MNLRFLWIGLGFAAGCTGMSLDESTPGGDTWLEPDVPGRTITDSEGTTTSTRHGAFAVDPRTEQVFVMQETTRTSSAGERVTTRKRVYRVDPERGNPRPIASVDEASDVRVLFPADGILLMSEYAEGDQLRMLDPNDFHEIDRVQTSAIYHGTRLSPSRRYLVVADNTYDVNELHFIDTRDLSIEEFPFGDASYVEAMWLQRSDVLVAIVFEAEGGEGSHARILTWDARKLAGGGSSGWDDPDLDIVVPDTYADSLFSFTWVGTSPDDHTVVFPVLRGEGAFDSPSASAYELIVLDVDTGGIRHVESAKGPVGFTPDGATIVSYNDAHQLLMIDVETLDRETIPIPTSSPEFFVSHEGSFVVVASALGGSRLVLYDADMGTTTTLEGPGIELRDFVSRLGHGELWLADEGLYRLDFMASTLDRIDLPFRPSHIQVLPERDLIVLDDYGTPNVHFYSPNEARVVRTTQLPAAL